MSQTAPGEPQADRNLLFGILAVQMDFVSRDALIAAMNAWVLNKHKPLGELLQENGALTPQQRHVLDLVAAEHLKAHGDDPQKSLAAVGVPETLSGGLESLADADVQASLAAAGPAVTTIAERPSEDGLRYQVLRPHAQGGLGVVSVARDAELGREVAFKEIQARYAEDETLRGRFTREAEITGGLEHPGIVPVYGLGRHADGRPYYAMRFIRGESLQEAARKLHAGEAGYTLRGLLTRFVAVSNAVAYAHSRGVLHRDLKPSNVMLGPYGETLVVDWGLAKVVGRESTDAGGSAELTLQPPSGEGSLTQAGSALGTPAYMSPEQARGEVEELGPATDVYSLGATLYALLTGRPPVQGRDTADILEKVRQGDWPPPRQVKPAVSMALDAVCRKAMALKPSDRYGSPLELSADVERWLADEPVTAWREPWVTRAGRWVRRHRTKVAAGVGAAFVTLLSVGAALLWQQSEHARRVQVQGRQTVAAEASLDRASDLLSRERLREARTALEQAEELAPGAGPGTIQRRAEDVRRNLELVARLDDIRQKSVNKFAASTTVLDLQATAREYWQAFAAANLGLPGAAPDRVAKQVAQSPVREAIVSVLDDWARVTTGNERAWALEVARLADPDPWRDRLRDPLTWEDEQKLAKLARETPVTSLTKGLAAAIGDRLRSARAGVDILRTAQAAWPTDFWLNYNLATALGDNGRWAEAEGFYRAALALRPDISVTHYGVGSALDGQGKKDEAYPFLVKAFDLYPNKPPGMKPEVTWAWAIGQGGWQWEHLGKLAEAEALCRKAIEADPTSPAAHGALGWVLERQGKWDEAFASCRKASELDPKNVPAVLGLGALLERQGKAKEAAEFYRKAVEASPKDVATLNLYASLLERRGKWKEAGAFYCKAYEENPNDINAAKLYATFLSNRGKWKEAAPLYRKALQTNPRDANTAVNLAGCLCNGGEWDEAEAFCRQVLEKNPKDLNVRYFFVASLKRQGKHAELEAYLRAILRASPEDVDACQELASLLDLAGKPDEAEELYRKNLRENPKDGHSHQLLAAYLQRRGKWEEAEALCRKGLQLAPDDYSLRETLASNFEHAGKWEELEDLFRKALQRQPADWGIRFRLARRLEIRGKREEAEALFRKAAEDNPKDAVALTYLASYVGIRGGWEEAETLYRKAVEVTSNDANYRSQLAYFLESRGKWQEAGALYRQSLRESPFDSNLRNQFAAFLERRGQWAESEALCRKTIAEDPDDVNGLYMLSSLLENQGKWEEAAATYRKAIELRTGPDQIPTSLSRVLLAQGQYPEAKDAARRAEAADLNGSKLYQRLAACGGRLAAVLKRDDHPANASEALDFAELCWIQRRYSDAVRLTTDAFAADPKLANDFETSRRYKAASHAASAGTRKPSGADKADEAEKAVLRSQARQWFRADLDESRKLARDRARWPAIYDRLQGLLLDGDLSGVRDPGELARFPEAERKEWEAFWSEVRVLAFKDRAR
jgi:tetratricopeptide (TPR) repeat protein